MPLFGNRRNFDRLMLAHLADAERFAVRLTGHPDAAKDLVQDAMLKAARSWRTFRGDAAFRSWLFRILINAFRDRAAAAAAAVPRTHRDRADLSLADAVPSPAPSPHADLERAELAATVAAAVSALPPRQREVVVLIVYEQLTAAEAARLLDTTEQNIRTTLHLGRKKLMTALAPYCRPESCHAP